MLAEIAVDNELVTVELDVDSDVTELFVLERPVDNELTPVDSELAVVDVEVDSELTPVDNDAMLLVTVETELDIDPIPVDSEVTAWLVAKSCEPLTASVLVALTRPAATFVI
ncbi:hypothetical protein [Burkholderia sp. LS-044]|uniref:hypothetical protein n=1 Tax=Burkholderia sp. LS-044 TaxID=1459967 RepID=UPI001FFE848F|nr:hypothetical protein [Burkholderia sp. LS-044]